MDRVKRIWYLSPMRAVKVQASLRICAVSSEPSLLAHTSSESRGTFRQKARSLAPLNGWACAVKIYHDGMLEDTNSLDGAHLFSFLFIAGCDGFHPLIGLSWQKLCWRPVNSTHKLDIWPCAWQSSLSAWRHLSYLQSAQWRLISLGGCPGWSEALLSTHVILLVLSCYGSYCLLILGSVLFQPFSGDLSPEFTETPHLRKQLKGENRSFFWFFITFISKF